MKGSAQSAKIVQISNITPDAEAITNRVTEITAVPQSSPEEKKITEFCECECHTKFTGPYTHTKPCCIRCEHCNRRISMSQLEKHRKKCLQALYLTQFKIDLLATSKK